MPASTSTSTVSNNSPSPTSNNPPSMDNVNSPTTTTSTITTPLTSTTSSQASTTTTTTTTAQQSSLNNTPTTTSITSSAFPSSSQSQSQYHQQSHQHHQQHQHQQQQQYHQQQQSLSNSISVADDHVKDYLHFRGFNETIRAFDKESRNDPSKIFSCEKIVEQLFFYLKQYEIIKCIEYWRYLEKKYFVYMLLSSSQDEYPHSQHSQHSQHQSSSSSSSSVNVSLDESSSSKINNNSSSNNVNSSNQGNSSTSNGSISISISSSGTSTTSSSSSNNRDSLTTSTTNNSNSSNSTSNTSGGNHNQINFNSYSSNNNNSRHNGVCETVRKLEQSLKKFYVVNCVQMNRLDKIRDFFEEFGVELIRDDEEWKDWFILPFLKLSDVQNTKLEPYFHKNWLEMLYVSLYNFISTSLMRAERPMLLTLESDQRDRLTSLKRKVNMLMNENESLRSKLIAAEMYIAKLERDAGIHRDQIPANASPSDNDHVQHARSSSILTHSAVNQRTTSSGSGSGGGSSGSDDDGGNDDQDTRGDLTPVTNNSDMLGTGDSVSGSTLLPNTSADSNRGQQDVWEEGAALSGEVTNATPAVSQQRVSSPTSATSNSDMESQMLTRRRSHRDLPQDYGRLKQLQPKKTLSGHKRFVTQCKFNSEGTAVATAALDRYTRVWSLSNSSCVAFDCGAPALSVEWIKKNESLLLSGSSNGRLRVCNTETGKFASETVTENMRYKNICDLASCPTNGNSCIVSCLNDEASATFKGIILGYNLKQMKVENRFSLEPDVAVSTVSFNHNGSMFVAAGNDGYIRVYDAKRADPIMKWKAHNGYVTSIQFSRNETTILSTGTDGRIVQWSAHHEGKILDEICPDFYVTGSDGVTSQFGSPNFIPKMSHMTDGNEMFAFSNPAVVYSMISKKPVYSFSTAVMSALDCHSHGHDEVKIVGADIDTFNVSLYSFIS